MDIGFRWVATALLAPWLWGCSNFIAAESERPEDQPGIAEGQRDLDDELCWQELSRASDDGVTSRSALAQDHAECMRAKGWESEE